MRAINNKIFPSIALCSLLFGIQGCKESTLIFPEQINVDVEDGVIVKGPVKQNNFAVITNDDELVQFDLSTVDRERVKSLYFSHDVNGERVDTEVTNFDEVYVIKNLPLRTATSVEVWASGYDDLLSNKSAYLVTPLPYPSAVISESLVFDWQINAGYIRLSNTTRTSASFFYKIDNGAYQEVLIASPTLELDIDIEGLAKGTHVLSYYIKDLNGGQTPVLSKEFYSQDIVKIPNTELIAEVSSTESGEGAGNGVGASLIDGDVNTYWHSTWSSSANPIFPHWIVLDMGSIRSFTRLEMIRRHNNTEGGFKNFTIEYSNDKSVWNVLQKDLVFNSADSPASFQQYNFTPTSARYIRIFITTPHNGTQTNTHLAEVNVYEVK